MVSRANIHSPTTAADSLLSLFSPFCQHRATAAQNKRQAQSLQTRGFCQRLEVKGENDQIRVRTFSAEYINKTIITDRPFYVVVLYEYIYLFIKVTENML